ncbi:MAG: fused MFS/spermidine synthase [Kiritimatiellae bacterium]|nr:fused MFS/spermidine synthase [Kiritimatiellia bacterium]
MIIPLTIFLGSFLLFLVQPLVGRTILPFFGGSAAVWGVCLAVYQTLLVGGYLYAHALARGNARPRLKIHAGLLFAAALWLFLFTTFRQDALARCGNSAFPWLEALGCVVALVGIPYVLLSAGSTLVQATANAILPQRDRSVYRLYAVSNAGSFLALLLYPFLLEPYLSLTVQWWAFGIAVLVYAVLVCHLAFLRPATDTAVPSLPNEIEAQPLCGDSATRLHPLWFWLPGLFSFQLNAVVTHLFIDVTPLPLVWVSMLAIFLLGYMVGFSKAGGFLPRVWNLLALFAVLAAFSARREWGTGSFLPNAIAAGSVLFFGGSAMIRWLYETRPAPAFLSRFYLCTAIGGAAGGLLATFVSPLLFTQVWEYPLALIAVAACCGHRLFFAGKRTLTVPRPIPALLFGAAATACSVWMSHPSNAIELYSKRNFYGSIRVTKTLEQIDRVPMFVSYMWDGQTTHGIQIRHDAHRADPLAYYMPYSAGTALLSHEKYRSDKPMKVGMVGLGAGIMAVYGRKNDLYRFYELNPQVIDVAKNIQYFSFLHDAECLIDLVPGDARRMLTREQQEMSPRYDVLYIDAYSGDAIPYHLATKEAFQLYLDRLEPDGILAVHVSNWHINLLPLCKSVAKELGLYPYGIVTAADASSQLVSSSIWVFLSRTPRSYIAPEPKRVFPVRWDRVPVAVLPTDEKGSLMPFLSLRGNSRQLRGGGLTDSSKPFHVRSEHASRTFP